MNALILTASAGGGHTATAEAISEYMKKQDPESRICIVDAIRYINPVIDKVVIGTYLNSLKVSPKAYNMIYSSMNKSGTDSLSSNAFVDKMEVLAASRLLPLVEETEPDIIISTHPFNTQLLASLRRAKKIMLPTMSIITDYGIHSKTIENDIDCFVIAHEKLIPEMTSRGIPMDKILPAGIPVRSSFGGSFDRKATLNSIGLDENKLTVTLMSGSMALGRMETLLKELDSIEGDFNIIVLTSKNIRLYDKAVEISLESDKSIAVMRYCNFMDSLLYSTDLLVTKPGGLTVSEALISGVPMAIFSAVGGQEEQNTRFLNENRLALDLGNGKNSADQIRELLFDEAERNAMRQRSLSFAKPRSAAEIYRQASILIEKARAERLEAPAKVEEENEDNLAKLRSIADSLKEDLENIPLISAVMDKVRSYYHDNDEDNDLYKLNDDEMNEIFPENSEVHHPPVRSRN